MTILQSIILGIVEGLTEYLPVSSTGHLIITRYILGLGSSDALNAFDICIQSGAILAVLGLYFQRVQEMWDGVMGRNKTGVPLIINMFVGVLPAVVLGLLCESYIKSLLFNETTVTITWALGGIVILLYSRAREKSGKGFGGKPLEELTWKGALKVGLMQCIAMCPGVSRSLMTMLGGLVSGLSVSAAVEFSFLLGLVTLGGATCHDAIKHGSEMVAVIGWAPMLVGTFTAWLSSIIAVKWMVGYLNKHGLSIFGWYRIAAAIVMVFFIWHGLRISDNETPEPPASETPVAAAPTGEE
ncbi:MAG: undecaprenyl-diphosphate phosphatase [Akkermansia sp.]|nr:undecaprenyl-diphosphate phosphatase [Akkermansia sp.]